ncbi:MAG: Kae1-associated serine/threonine protein kinase [Candidatus Aenigmarchaeota archaeon]|nr:Kae1-associated serine/threonine protein kinase [Candidatus Aenigmarchaeota archaeon]
MQILSRGAEAVLYVGDDGALVKERVKKGYRLHAIDNNLRKKRTRGEAKLMREARRAGVSTPQIREEGEYSIKMDFIDGRKVRDILSNKNMKELCEKIGEATGRMHSYDIIHGDLTTSNMIFSAGKVFFIDFGLGFQSRRTEDKAVDLRLLKQALDSTHYNIAEKAWKIILKAYERNNSDAGKVIKTLQEIEKRGRYAKRD